MNTWTNVNIDTSWKWTKATKVKQSFVTFFNIEDDDTPTSHIENIRQQIDDNEEALTEMINGLTEEQLESLRTIVAYLWEKSYSDKVFNKSTLLKLMREQLNLRQDDIQKGIATEIAKRIASERTVANRMVQEGEITQEQMEKFMKRLEEYKKDSQ